MLPLILLLWLCSVVLVLAYISYMFASAAFLSGITAVVVCGMVGGPWSKLRTAAAGGVYWCSCKVEGKGGGGDGKGRKGPLPSMLTLVSLFLTYMPVFPQVMHAYMRPNVSATSQIRITVVSKTLAIALELFAFVYIGMSAMQPQYYDIFTFVVSRAG
jgi:NhaP-type Na+/H+ or K+/H+ antiporter